MSEAAKGAPRWTADHESLLDLARRLEEARRVNNAVMSERAIFHQADRGVVETSRDFEREKQNAREAGMPIHPRFQSWTRWEETARSFHEAFRATYPPETTQRVAELARGEQSAVEWAVIFLEADPRCFRAGYLRERVLRYLTRMLDQLGADERARLRQVALAAIDDSWRPTPYDLADDAARRSPRGQAFLATFGDRLAGIKRRNLLLAQRREFKWYCRLASKLDGDDLKHQLERRAIAADAVVARRASLMLGAMARRQKPTQQA